MKFLYFEEKNQCIWQYALFTAIKKPLLSTSLKSWGEGDHVLHHRMDWGFKLPLLMEMFSQPFSMATFLNKITIPTQLYPFSVIWEQNNSQQKVFIGSNEMLQKRFILCACAVCMRVDTCCIACLDLHLK